MNKNEGRERTKGKKGIAFITDDGNRLSAYLRKWASIGGTIFQHKTGKTSDGRRVRLTTLSLMAIDDKHFKTSESKGEQT